MNRKTLIISISTLIIFYIAVVRPIASMTPFNFLALLLFLCFDFALCTLFFKNKKWKASATLCIINFLLAFPQVAAVTELLLTSTHGSISNILIPEYPFEGIIEKFHFIAFIILFAYNSILFTILTINKLKPSN